MVVSIDGCRPDAFLLANTPNVDALIASGSASYDARHTLEYGESGPNCSSMLTGTRLKHGVTSNSWNADGFLGNHFDQWPYMFSYLEAADPSLSTASYRPAGVVRRPPLPASAGLRYDPLSLNDLWRPRPRPPLP